MEGKMFFGLLIAAGSAFSVTIAIVGFWPVVAAEHWLILASLPGSGMTAMAAALAIPQ